MTDGGHRYSFGAPSKGWPTFGPDGRIVKEPTFAEVFAEEHRRVAEAIIRDLFTPCGLCGGEHPYWECDYDPSDWTPKGILDDIATVRSTGLTAEAIADANDAIHRIDTRTTVRLPTPE